SMMSMTSVGLMPHLNLEDSSLTALVVCSPATAGNWAPGFFFAWATGQSTSSPAPSNGRTKRKRIAVWSPAICNTIPLTGEKAGASLLEAELPGAIQLDQRGAALGERRRLEHLFDAAAHLLPGRPRDVDGHLAGQHLALVVDVQVGGDL